jgi:hypothetical protein
MATFYQGPRPVLKGRTTAEMVNPYDSMTGKAKGTGTYSFYPLYSTSHVLDGAPDNHFDPGTGQFPGNRFMSQIFNGSTLYVHPLSGTFPDGTATYDGARFKPNEYKGLAGASAFPSTFGHAYNRVNDYALYDNSIFDGVPSADIFANTGHADLVVCLCCNDSANMRAVRIARQRSIVLLRSIKADKVPSEPIVDESVAVIINTI